jgi:hypothetical protein
VIDHVTIVLARIDKPPRTYQEGFLSDNGTELRTMTALSPEVSVNFSRDWQKAGCFSEDQCATTVRKILFYHEYFSIMQLLDSESRSLGCYVDIATPLKNVNGVYQLTDLILDLWITPNGCYTELDVDEFEQAVSAGKLIPEWELRARQTFSQLKTEIDRGDFPGRYFEK